MKIKILQINMDRDTNRIAFESYDGMMKYQGKFDISIYDEVWSGEVQADDLEDVYTIFNVNHPEGYTGRSLSVSDLVKTEDGLYFCDSIGFRKVG